MPCFLYGPERTLPEVRRGAFTIAGARHRPAGPHPTAGAIAVGARPVLVAYNLWLAEPDLDGPARIARDLRGPAVRALGLAVGRTGAGVDEPDRPDRRWARPRSTRSWPRRRRSNGPSWSAWCRERCSKRSTRQTWERLDLALDRTIESRIEAQTEV